MFYTCMYVKKKYVYLSEYSSESLGTCFIGPKAMRTAIYIMYVYKTRFAGMSSHCSILNNTYYYSITYYRYTIPPSPYSPCKPCGYTLS